MTDAAVELRNVTKVFQSGGGAKRDEVHAVNDMNLSIQRGEFFTLLGPSGCGKTTTLRLIAGFEAPTKGEILIQGKSMEGVPPYLRPVNTVFQNYALFPHMNVWKNVAFGLAVKRVPRDERKRRAEEALELVQLPGMETRKPSQLSGGQQQRVALARALVNQPAVLLLDEPLGALDFKLRKAMQIELKHLQERVGITFVYVTHDQEEALTMSDRIAVMHNGVVQQVGDPVSLYERPATRFVADFIGESNFISCNVAASADGEVRLLVGDERVRIETASIPGEPGKTVTVVVRPERIQLAAPEGFAGEAVTGMVKEAVYIGTHTRYVITLASGDEVVVRIQNVTAKDIKHFKKGDKVKLSWNPEDARVLRA